MIDNEIKLPFFIRAIFFFIGIFALLVTLYISQKIVVPLIFAIIIAILLHPVVNFFVRIRVNRILAILITLLIAFLIIAGIGVLLFSQLRRFGESWPVMIDKITVIFNHGITWASGYFDINAQKLHVWVAKTQGELIDTSGGAIGQTLIDVGTGVVLMLFIPVYIFMILVYQPLLIEFIRRLFGRSNKSKVNEIISETKSLIQQYIIGLFIEFAIVAVLYSAGLRIIGFDYAILLGFIAALLNIIPYIGGFIAVILFMIIAIATKNSSSYPVLVLGLYVVVHFIDNSFIIPKIVASKVKINALVSITVIIAANRLLGVPGMIICIPIMGIVKLIFDRVEPLKPWGFLLGDTMPGNIKIKPVFKDRNKFNQPDNRL